MSTENKDIDARTRLFAQQIYEKASTDLEVNTSVICALHRWFFFFLATEVNLNFLYFVCLKFLIFWKWKHAICDTFYMSKIWNKNSGKQWERFDSRSNAPVHQHVCWWMKKISQVGSVYLFKFFNSPFYSI